MLAPKLEPHLTAFSLKKQRSYFPCIQHFLPNVGPSVTACCTCVSPELRFASSCMGANIPPASLSRKRKAAGSSTARIFAELRQDCEVKAPNTFLVSLRDTMVTVGPLLSHLYGRWRMVLKAQSYSHTLSGCRATPLMEIFDIPMLLVCFVQQPECCCVTINRNIAAPSLQLGFHP